MKKLPKSTSISVLIIDAKPAYLEVVQSLLSEYKLANFELIGANSLSASLTILNTKSIDAILLNPTLHDSQGIMTFRELNRVVINTPIILLTEAQDETLAIQSITEGAQDYFIKGAFEGKLLARSITYAIERKNTEILLNEYAEIIENASEAIFSISIDGTIKSWNGAAELIYQYHAEEIIGKPFMNLIASEHRENADSIIKSILAGQIIKERAIKLLNKFGKKMDILITVTPIKNKAGTIVDAAVLAQDYTQHKLSESQLALQLKVATVLAESTSLNNATRSILKTICGLLEFTAAELWVIDREDNVLRYILNWDEHHKLIELSEVSQKLVLQRGEGIPGYIWENPEPHWITTLNKDEIAARGNILETIGLNCCFGFPIVFQGEILGVLLFFGSNIDQPDMTYINMFTAIGKQFGAFIKHKRLENELLHLAQHDLLTGLANKFVAVATLKDLIIRAKTDNTLVALLYLDLDHFKDINDTLGHEIGDIILREVAKRLLKVTRETDLVARFGGDEFAIVLAGITSKEDVELIANKVLDIIALPYFIEQNELHLTTSIGISLYPYDGDDVSNLMRTADMAMYQAKNAGRNSYTFSSILLEEKQMRKYLLEKGLQQALDNNEFVLYYQPIADVQTNKIINVEALIRWMSPKGPLILPNDFIFLAEKGGLISKIGEWVLRTACNQLKMWRPKGLHTIAVNISVHQLSEHFIEQLKSILVETDLQPNNLILEITESVLMKRTKLMTKIFSSLNKMGVRISLDDFGTGYSSFASLNHFTLHNIKIDRSFVMGLDKHPQSSSIIEAIIVMAHVLNMKTIAEGVETKNQLDFLKEKGCNEYQGFYFSKPLPPEELVKLLEKE